MEIMTRVVLILLVVGLVAVSVVAFCSVGGSGVVKSPADMYKYMNDRGGCVSVWDSTDGCFGLRPDSVILVFNRNKHRTVLIKR